jgi:hypothetical protein
MAISRGFSLFSRTAPSPAPTPFEFKGDPQASGLSFSALQSLMDKTANLWTPKDLALFGINTPEPQTRQEQTAFKNIVNALRPGVVDLVRGVKYANDPESSFRSIDTRATKRINEGAINLQNAIEKYGGNVNTIPNNLIQTSLQNADLIKNKQPITPFPNIPTVERAEPTPYTGQPTPLLSPTQLSQAPALTREYYLSQGIPESMLPPRPSPLPSLPPAPVGNTPIPGITSTAGQPLAGTTMQTNTPQSFLGGVTPGALLPENLPALRGSATGTSSIDPTLRPYLELGLRGAEQLFLQQQPSLYPGQMFVGPSPQTQAALNMQEDIALSRPTSLEAAQESYMRGLGGLGATAGGAFLMGNPYQQAAIEAASRPIQRQFAETTLPGIASGFSLAGRYGSQAMGTALGSATAATARALGDVGTNIAYGGYEAERGRQQQAMLGQIQSATLAPQIYGQQFLPSQQLAQVGAAREAIAGQPLQEAIQRYQFQQQIPYQQLQGFLSSIYGTPMAASQYAPPAQTNRLASTLGGAALGAGVGQMIGGSFGGFGAPAIGAGLGALGGLLF